MHLLNKNFYDLYSKLVTLDMRSPHEEALKFKKVGKTRFKLLYTGVYRWASTKVTLWSTDR